MKNKKEMPSADEIKEALNTYHKSSPQYLEALLQALVLVEVYNIGREPSEKLEIKWTDSATTKS